MTTTPSTSDFPSNQNAQLANGYPESFARAVAQLLADEGGYSDNPADPGGATRYGISARSFPGVDLSRLTRNQAAALYYRDFWLRYRYGDLEQPVGEKVFNLAVNMGPYHAALCLQRALRACGRPVAEDGILGPVTMGAARAVGDPIALLTALRSEAAGYYRLLAALGPARGDPDAVYFLSGWLNRAYQ